MTGAERPALISVRDAASLFDESPQTFRRKLPQRVADGLTPPRIFAGDHRPRFMRAWVDAYLAQLADTAPPAETIDTEKRRAMAIIAGSGGAA